MEKVGGGGYKTEIRDRRRSRKSMKELMENKE